MTKGVPFVQITMLFMQTTFKYCAKYTIIHLLEEKEISIMYIQGGICMISFLVCLALLIGGYFVYGNLVNNIFNPDDRETPAVRINDGVDYVVMPQWKLFLIQLLNIAVWARSSEPCRVHCGDRSYSCGSPSVRSLPAVFMTSSPA